MALTPAQISSYIAKAQRAQEAGMLDIIDGQRSGKKGQSLYYPMQFLSAGVDVLNSNHGLTNLQIEIIVQEMIEQGNLNDFSGDPIPYLTNTVIINGGGGGVSSFSAGNLSPLFTTTVFTPTTTPDLEFSLVSQTQNLVYASPNGSSGTPYFRALVSADLPAGAITGSGTLNYIPLWTPNGSTLGNSILQQSGTTIFLSSGKLGINKSSAVVELDVLGQSNILNGTTVINPVGSTLVTNYAAWDEFKGTTTAHGALSVGSVSAMTIGSLGSVSASIFAGAISASYWDNAGGHNLNTGFVSPSMFGHTANAIVNASAGSVQWTAGYGSLTTSLTAGATTANAVGFYAGGFDNGATNNGTTTKYYAFYGKDQSGLTGVPSTSNRWGIYIDDPSLNYFSGNLGIGIITPIYPLDVVGIIHGSSTIILGAATTTSGAVGFYNSTNSNVVTLTSGITTVSHTLKLPTAQGAASTYLQNDGSGNLSWVTVAASGGTVTTVSVVTNQGVSGSVANPTTTPAITLTLGALTGVTSFNGLVITANTGAITTGTWTATKVGLSYGGTNADLSGTGGTSNYLKQSSVGATITVGTIPASDIGSGAALTKTDDTNVTLTLGGTPSTSLLAATSLALGWTGVLSGARGGTGVANTGFTITIAGNLTTTGAFNTTFATGFTGTITLPTATSTLYSTQSGSITSSQLATSLTDETGTGANVFGTSPTITTSLIMADAANVVINATTGTKIGTATTQKIGFYNATPIVQPTGDVITALQNLGLGASLTVTATTNANLTGPITSVGNSTSVAAQTGTGSTFVMQASPTITTPTFTTSITGPLHIGGSGTTSTLTFQTTTGIGTTGADFIWLGGNNGGTELMRLINGGKLGIGVTPTSKLHVVAGVLTASGGGSTITATMPNILSGYTNAIQYTVTGSGSSSQTNQAMDINFTPGYTGNAACGGLEIDNTNLSTGNDLKWGSTINNPLGNSGINAFCYGITTGANIANYVEAGGGVLNVGAFGKATTLKNSGTNIGVIGQGRNTGTSPLQIGGWFTLANAAPTYSSAALVCDNGDQSSPIFLAQAANSTVVTIDATGNLKLNATGKGFYIKSGSNCKIGTGTLVGGTVTITNTSVSAASVIFITDTTSGSLANVGTLAVVAGSGSFVVTSTNVLDTSTFNYIVFETN